MEKKQPRWRINPETAVNLRGLQQRLGYKSWDDFFVEMIRKFDYDPRISPARLEARDMKNVLKVLHENRENLIEIKEALEARDDLMLGIQSSLDETQKIQIAIKNLLALALGEDEGREKTNLQVRLEGRGKK